MHQIQLSHFEFSRVLTKARTIELNGACFAIGRLYWREDVHFAFTEFGRLG